MGMNERPKKNGFICKHALPQGGGSGNELELSG